MKLISMTDFVLEQDKLMRNKLNDPITFTIKVTDYALFLKQPLKLEMFVPCDEDGNVLEEKSIYADKDKDYIFESKKFDAYQQAKSKVLFEGFELLAMTKTINEEDVFISIKNKKDIRNKMFSSWFEKGEIDNHSEEKTIEDLIKYDLTLTPNAIKQLGL